LCLTCFLIFLCFSGFWLVFVWFFDFFLFLGFYSDFFFFCLFRIFSLAFVCHLGLFSHLSLSISLNLSQSLSISLNLSQSLSISLNESSNVRLSDEVTHEDFILTVFHIRFTVILVHTEVKALPKHQLILLQLMRFCAPTLP
jgi:hypothetical protein